MKKSVISVLALVIFLCVLSSCNEGIKSSKQNDEILQIDVESKENNKFENAFSGPSPEEMMMIFESNDIVFHGEALNSNENVSNYISSKSLKYNLGVYVTDAAYLNLFKQYSLMTDYLESIFKITDKLNLSGVYLRFDFKKVFKQMDNPDSLIVLSEGVYHAVTEYMTENNNEESLCLISFGAFIEMLHLTFQSVDNFNAESPIMQHISDQYMQVENLLEFSSQYSDNDDIVEIMGYLESIQKIWNKAAHTNTETVLSQANDGKLKISGGEKHSLTNEQFNEFKNLISEIRTKITS